MSANFLDFHLPVWWLLIVIIVSILATYFHYQKILHAWSKKQNWLLASIRFFGIFLLLTLILEPTIRVLNHHINPPVVAIAVDNSQSIALSVDTLAWKEAILNLEKDLKKNNLEVITVSLSTNNLTRFNKKTTNLSNLIEKAQETAEGQNLSALVLLTDGIYNQGSSPLYQLHKTPIFAVGVGDTTATKNVSISRILYNSVTLKGNQNPFRIEISQHGFTNQKTTLVIKNKGEVLAQKNIVLSKSIQEINFQLEASQKGLQRYTVLVDPLDDEFSTKDNIKDLFFEVVDAKKKVLIAAHHPHPDIKAIKSVLSLSDNFEVETYIPSIDKTSPKDLYDVVIYHGEVEVPNVEQTGKWHISSTDNISQLASKLSFLDVVKQSNRPDKINGSFNTAFKKFTLENTTMFERYPPVEVVFGEYSVSGPTEVLLFQKVGNITTDKPLMLIYDDGNEKVAALLGQNIWRWKLQEIAISGAYDDFKEFVTKTVQYLSLKNKKKPFIFSPVNSIFSDVQPIQFETEIYDEIYRRIYGNSIQLSVRSEDGKKENYSFVNSSGNSTLKIPSLPVGIYQYTATTRIGKKEYAEKGEFSIKENDIEYQNMSADFGMLRELSQASGGQFFQKDQLDKLTETLINSAAKPKTETFETLLPLEQNKWWYILIFVLFSLEWFLRRWLGGY